MRSIRNPSHHPKPYPQPHPHPLTLTIDVNVPIAVTDIVQRNRTPYTVSVNPTPTPSDEMEGIVLSSRFAIEARPWVSAVCMGEPLEELIDTAEDTCGERWTRG